MKTYVYISLNSSQDKKCFRRNF